MFSDINSNITQIEGIWHAETVNAPKADLETLWTDYIVIGRPPVREEQRWSKENY